MTAEGSRHTSDTSQQPSAYRDQTADMKAMIKMIKEMDNKKTEEMFEIRKEMDKNKQEILEIIEKMDNKIMTLSDTVHTQLHPPDRHNRAFPGKVIQTQNQEEEEKEMLKKQIKNLEARNKELLAKAMAMHQNSEDMNDPSRLSAVLERYEMLRLQEWEKVRISMPYRWTYEKGSRVIKKMFDACEEDIQRRTDDILQVLSIPLTNNDLTKVMMRDIMELFRRLYHQNSMVYDKIVQDPPVKAEWQMDYRYLEHVDKKDMHWENPSLLWPIMKRGEEIIVKGVVWD